MTEYSIDGFLEVTEYEDGGRKVMIDGYEVHPDAAAFDVLTGEAMQELCESIAKNGLRQKILVTLDWQIVDGQNRLLACLAAGVEPEFETVTYDSIPDLIIDQNLMRRHLTPSQRAAMLVRLRPGLKDDEVAVATGVNPRTAQKARRVQKDAVPEVKKAVEAGEMSLHVANEVAQLPAAEQRGLIEHFGNESRDRDSRGKSGITSAAVAAAKPQKPFRFESWADSAEKRLSKLVAQAPEDLRDRARGRLAQALNATVRLAVDDDSMESFEDSVLTPEGVLEKLEQMLASLPKSERKQAEELIRQRFPTEVEPVKKAAEAKQAIDAIRAGLSQAEQKKLAKELEEAPAGIDLPEDPQKAVASWKRQVESVSRKIGEHKLPEEVKPEFQKAATAAYATIARALRDSGALKDAEEVVVPKQFNDPEFEEMWEKFLQQRRLRKLPTSNSTQNQQLKRLACFDSRQAVEVLSKAIEGEWKGIPVTADLAQTLWDGRPPAFQPDLYVPKRNGAGSKVSDERAKMIERANYGKFFENPEEDTRTYEQKCQDAAKY